MSGGRMLPAVSVLAVLVLAAGVLHGRSQVTSTVAATDGPPPEPSVETVTLSPFLDGVDDGLNRLVVSVDLTTAVAPPPPDRTPQTIDGTGVDGHATHGTAVDEDIWLNDPDDPLHLDRADLSPADAELLRRLHGDSRQHGGPQPEATTTQAADVTDVMATIAAVEGVEDVTLAGPDHVAVATSLAPTDLAVLPGVGTVQTDHLRTIASMDYQPHQWALANPALPSADIRWAEANAVADGTGVVVAVIDTGIDTSHPDLIDQMWTNEDEVCDNGVDDDANGYVDDCQGWDFANDDPSVDDGDLRHGTHVAGIIAADHDAHGVTGVAPGAVVMPLKVSHDGAITASRLARAIDYAVDNGADVINMSLAGYGASDVEVAACGRADAAGVVMVAAMGNDGRDVTATPTYPAALDLPSMIAVSSSDEQDAQAGHSNHSATLADVHAPGQRILSAFPDLRLAYLSGTSMATPNVAGVAALVVQTGVRGAAVRQTIMDTAMPRPSLGGRSLTGARLDAAAAVGVPAGDVTVVVGSVHDARPGVPDVATIQVTGAPAALAGEQTDVAVSLGRVHGGALYAVTDLPLTVGGTTTTTDGDGRTVVGAIGGQAGTGLSTSAGWTLPAGEYVLAVEVMDPRPGQPALATHVVGFAVTTGPPATAPAPGDTADSTSGGTTPDGGGTDGGGGAGGTDAGGSDGGGAGNTDGPADDPVIGEVDPGPITTVPGGLSPDGSTSDDQHPDAPDPDGSGSDAPTDDGPDTDGQTAGVLGTGVPGDGITPDTDEAPANDAAGGDPGTSTAPQDPGSTSTPGGDGDVAPRPEPVEGTVFPATGRPEGGSMATVTVPAGIPDGSHVRFGGTPATLISAGTTAVTVQVPAHAVGPVDVTILVPDGRRLVLPAAFTYVDDRGAGQDGDVPVAPPTDTVTDDATSPDTATGQAALDAAGADGPDGGASGLDGGASGPDAGASGPDAGASGPDAGASGPDDGAGTPDGDTAGPDDGAAPDDAGTTTGPPPSGGAITVDGLTLTPPSATSALSGISMAVLPGARCASASCTAVAV